MAAPIKVKLFSPKLLQYIGCHFRTVSGLGRYCHTASGSNSQNGGSDAHVHEDFSDTEYDTKLRILRSSLPFVHSHGWTTKAISKGAEVEGLPGIAHGLFPRGGVELVFFFYTDCNRRLAEQLAEKVKQEQEDQMENQSEPAAGQTVKKGSKTTPFIRGAIETRLRMITPYIDKWPQAMAIMAIPQNAPEALSNLKNLTDDIWHFAGDTSTDFNWYTKRAVLAGVYKATEVYMVQDKSEDFTETWEFLDRRMEDLASFSKLTKNSDEAVSVLSEACKGLFIMGKNIIGANSRSR